MIASVKSLNLTKMYCFKVTNKIVVNDKRFSLGSQLKNIDTQGATSHRTLLKTTVYVEKPTTIVIVFKPVEILVVDPESI